jgi:hypothetical protein
MTPTFTMEDFERLVLAQKPAETPWQAVTDYSFEARKAIEGIHPQLIKDTFAPTLVVDAGCGPDGILVKLLTDLGVEAIGFDPQIPKRTVNRRLMNGSLTDKRFMADSDKPFADLVICREVLEHLTLLEIRRAVNHLCRISSRYVYITTRFSSEHDLLRVDTSDDLDPTHITIAAKDFYRLLLTLEGFKRRADLEAAMDHQQKNRCLVYERVA